MNDLPDNEYARIRDLYIESIIIPSQKQEKQSLLCPVGYIGSGKSTVVIPLAERLGFVRVSSDEMRKLLKENGYNYDRAKEMAFKIILSFLDGGYSVAIDANCGSPETLNRIQEEIQKRSLKAFWIHVNPPEEFIVNKLRNYPHTWLFANEEEAVQNSLGRKKELGDLSLIVPYIYTFDTSAPNLSEQLKEAEGEDLKRIAMKEIKYKGKYLELTEEVIDGHVYERVQLNSGVRVYPIQDGKVLMIKEMRRHEGTTSRWRFIAGWMDKEEKDRLQVAKEELAEEVGMSAEKWEEFYVFETPNHTVSAHSTCFVALNPTKLELPPKNPDHDVISEVRWVSLDELWKMIDSKEVIWDALVFGGVQALRLFGGK